jgi:anti-sigma factor RsiW
MKCDRARKLISKRLDGELDQAGEALLLKHLDHCAACTAYAADLASLGLNAFEAPGPTPGFAAGVMARVEESPGQRPVVLSRPGLYRPIAVGLGLAASIAGFAVGSGLSFAAAPEQSAEPGVEQIASNAIDPLADESIETVLIAMLTETED